MNREEGFKAIARLQEAGMFNKPEGASAKGRNQPAKLRRRIADYNATASNTRINAGSYHKPGSNKK